MKSSSAPASTEHAGNNFDAIRIVAAFTVLFSHHHALTGQAEPRFLGLYTWGTAAVIVFFIISGYLVTASWYNDPSFVRFGLRRILRIWPALAVAAALTAYGLGAWVTSLPPGQYWTDGMTSGYLLNTLALRIRFALPGVFDGNPFPNSPNGSLWTIPFEVRCYAVLALAGLLGLMRNRRIWLLAVAAMMAWILYRNSAGLHAPTDYGREFSAFFLAGSALCVLRILRDR
jgi:peptidoglycan/LPS O-acetylase OafA/YrhL